MQKMQPAAPYTCILYIFPPLAGLGRNHAVAMARQGTAAGVWTEVPASMRISCDFAPADSLGRDAGKNPRGAACAVVSLWCVS